MLHRFELYSRKSGKLLGTAETESKARLMRRKLRAQGELLILIKDLAPETVVHRGGGKKSLRIGKYS